MNSLEGIRILVVEDEALIAEEIRDRLQSLGADVVAIVDTATDALQAAADHQPDIALMDIRLKGKRDGIEAAAELYSSYQVPSVFLTAYSDHETIARVTRLGQFGYLTKPFRDHDLAATVSLAHQHHRVEAGLRKSQLSLHQVFANASDGLMAVDAECRVRYLNPAAEIVLATEAENAIDRPIDEIVRLTDESGGQSKAGLIAASISEPSESIEALESLLLAADGSLKPVSLSVAPISDANGTVGAAISIRDLSRLKKDEADRAATEKVLQDQRLLLGTLIDGLPEMFFAIDRDLKVVAVNHALLHTFGLNRSETIGKGLDEIFAEGSLADVHRQASRALKTGNRTTYQQRAWMDDSGELRWFSFSYMPVPHGTDTVLACTAIDVTERRQLEDELLDATNREQRRLGRDLHDTLGQELASVALLVHNFERKLATRLPDLLPDTASIKETIAHAIESMRATARGLAPTDLRNGGLVLALKKLAARCAKARELQCRFIDNDVVLPALDARVAEHIYRFAQEATSNAARHSGATAIQLELQVTDLEMRLIIEDNGKGLPDGGNRQSGGFGLRIMEYRSHKIGGGIEFQSPPAGTRVILTVPLNMLAALAAETGQTQLSGNDGWEKIPPLEPLG